MSNKAIGTIILFALLLIALLFILFRTLDGAQDPTTTEETTSPVAPEATLIERTNGEKTLPYTGG